MWRTVLVVCLIAPIAPAAQSRGGNASDEAAIRTVVSSYVNARQLRNASAIESLFTVDADQHTTSGEWRRGRAEVMRGSMESSARNPGSRSITVDTIRFIRPDVVIADGPYEIRTGGNVRRMWTTIVLEREDGEWRIAAIRNMLPTASPPSRQEAHE